MECLHMISRDGGHSEGWEVGVNVLLEPFQKFIYFDTLTRPLGTGGCTISDGFSEKFQTAFDPENCRLEPF